MASTVNEVWAKVFVVLTETAPSEPIDTPLTVGVIEYDVTEQPDFDDVADASTEGNTDPLLAL